jgi:hypothetical protein
MSVTIQFLFNSPDDLREVGERAATTLGVAIKPYLGDPDDLFAHYLGLEMSLGLCDLENDRNIDFSSYRYNLSTRTAWAAAKRRVYQLEATVIAAYALMCDGVARDGMLVYEVQNLLAKYEPTLDGRVFDTVSGDLVVFPGHMEVLRARLTRGH